MSEPEAPRKYLRCVIISALAFRALAMPASTCGFIHTFNLVNFSDFFPTTWVQAHAAITHFPIALLLVATALEAGGLLFKRASWRDIAFAVLGLAVLSLPVALLSGYLTASTMRRPPVGFDLHWKAALVATAFAAAWWIWRWKTRSNSATSNPEKTVALRPNSAPWAMLGVAGLSALSVGYTGHLGGEMVFGGSDDETVVASAPTSSDDNRMEKIALAAGKMENAAGKMDVATDRLAIAAKNQKPAAPTVVAAPPVPPSEVKVDASALDRAAQNMERVATRFESTAQKMEAIAQQMQNSGSTKSNTSPAKNTATQSKAPDAKSPVIVSKVVPTAAPAAAVFDAQLVATGTKLFQSDDLGCLGCHKMNGKGGRSGPDLTHAGRLNADIEWQIAHLKNPESKTPGSKMPAYNDLPENDLRALATYMASLQ